MVADGLGELGMRAAAEDDKVTDHGVVVGVRCLRSVGRGVIEGGLPALGAALFFDSFFFLPSPTFFPRLNPESSAGSGRPQTSKTFDRVLGVVRDAVKAQQGYE